MPSPRSCVNAQKHLIALLKTKDVLKSAIVEDMLMKVDRACYCPSEQPYVDTPISIGYGSTISAPHMHAHALELLKEKLVDGAKVLDVGSGSGYMTTCFAHMIGPSGVVFGVDHIEQLITQSEENIRMDAPELLDSGRIKMVTGDGRLGLPAEGPFDVIHVGASAETLPQQLCDQLAEGGRMVIPVGKGVCEQMFVCVDKKDGQIIKKELFGVVYVPLTTAAHQLQKVRK